MPIPTPAIVPDDDGEDPLENYGLYVGNEDVQYRDPSLDPVVQDNLDIRVLIGPGQLVDDNTPSLGRDYFVTELEVHLTDGAESNYARGIVVPDGHDRKPSTGDPLDDDNRPDIITIDVDNELTEARPDTDGEITRIFTGIISNSSRLERGRFEFMAFWPGFNVIQNSGVQVSMPTPDVSSTEYQGTPYYQSDYTNTRQFASIIARDIAQDISEQVRFPFDINITDDGYDINGVKYATDTELAVQSAYIPITVEGSDEGMLTRVVNATNSVWEVDRYGNFVVGPPIPRSAVGEDEYVPTAIDSHKLRYITETTAGLQSPAWNSIVVIGSGVVSQDGWQSNAQLQENRAQYSEVITDKGRSASVEGNVAEPVFEYTNLEIDTETEARNVLKKLKEKIRKQAGNGEVTVVGHPEVWPGDSIELPDSVNQPFASERYGVEKVTHRINSSDGFITKIKVSGQTNANEAVWSDEVINPQDALNKYGSGPTIGVGDN
jgi:hypothetical protein